MIVQYLKGEKVIHYQGDGFRGESERDKWDVVKTTFISKKDYEWLKENALTFGEALAKEAGKRWADYVVDILEGADEGDEVLINKHNRYVRAVRAKYEKVEYKEVDYIEDPVEFKIRELWILKL